MPKVAVIVPIYNVEKYLPECLDSILNQTLSDIEIICVNDASQDNSDAILDGYAKRDNRIKIITHNRNKGLGPARNTGMLHSSSNCISFVDSDDYIANNFLEKLYELIKNNNAELAWCGFNKVSETGTVYNSQKLPEGIWSAPDVLNNEVFYFLGIQAVTNKMFIKHYISKIKQLPILIEDEPTIAQYFSYCYKIATTNKTSYFYRHSPVSLTNPVKHLPEYWDQFFHDYEMYFSILRKNFPDIPGVKKHIILRYHSLLWRIKTYSLLEDPEWREQEKIILYHLKKDTLKLKAACQVMFYYLMFLFKINWPLSIKKKLLNVSMKLSRGVWLKRSSFLLLAFDIFKAELPLLKNLIKKIFRLFGNKLVKE